MICCGDLHLDRCMKLVKPGQTNVSKSLCKFQILCSSQQQLRKEVSFWGERHIFCNFFFCNWQLTLFLMWINRLMKTGWVRVKKMPGKGHKSCKGQIWKVIKPIQSLWESVNNKCSKSLCLSSSSSFTYCFLQPAETVSPVHRIESAFARAWRCVCVCASEV